MNLFINQTVKHSCLFIFFLLLPSVSHAELGVNFSAQNIAMQQEIVVSGTVSDVNGELPGVNVLIKGTSQGVVTDGNGRFTIAVPGKETILQFSFIGYATQEIEVGNRIAIDVLLTENVQEIEEVVVVGYAVQKKATMTGAVTQVKGDDILKSGAVTTISQAIQGLMPGVTATVESGKPGREATDILIRGKGTWHSSSPLFLVDGVERNINDIDPNEIASISVLKDAAATAVYGVKGGNGVIIVTTKRGTDQRPSVSLNANFGFKQPTVMPEYADYVTSMEMWNEAATNDTQWNMLIPESTIAAWKNAFATGNYGPYNDYFPQVDWWNEMIKPLGQQQQYNLNIQGGSNFVKYFVSFGYLNEGDIFRTFKNKMYDPAFWYKRYNWRTNLDFNLTKSTVLSVNLAGKQGNRNQPGYRTGAGAIDPDTDTGVYQEAFFKNIYETERNTFPIRWSDGTYGAGFTGDGNLRLNFDRGQRMYKYYENFIDVGLKQDLDFITKGLSTQIKFSYTAESETQSIIQLLKLANFGGEGSYTNIIRYYRGYDYSKPLPNGGYELLPGENGYQRFPNPWYQSDSHLVDYDIQNLGGYGRRMHYEATLNYARTFGPHAVTALGVFDRYENEALQSGSSTNMKYQEREEAWVTRTTYTYGERYLFEFNGAYTGSMRFAPGKRFKFFPSYSVGWRISEEPFIKKSSISNVLNDLKVRYSVGTVGYDRNASFFTYVQTYSMGGANSGLLLGSSTTNRYGPFITEGKTANVNATWETSYKDNLGLDFRLLNSKITGSFDFFKEKREGILMTSTKPGWFGIKDPDANIGRTKSRGLEVDLGWNSTIGNNFRYWLKANFSTSENRIIERNDGLLEEEYRKFAGKPIDVQRRLGVAGYYTSLDDIFNYTSNAEQRRLIPGDFMYIDYNADGVVLDNETDKLLMKEQNYPRQTYGWSLGGSWKNFDFSMMWYGVSGVYKNIAPEMLWDLRFGRTGNYSAYPDVVNRWTPETASYATKPALHSNSDSRMYNERSSTYVYQSASYLRLKSVELSYSLDKRYIDKVGMSKCQLYVSGNNLLTFTQFNKSIDPESNKATLYPMVRRYNVGIRVGF